MTQLKNRWLVNLALIALVMVLAIAVYFKRAEENHQRGPLLTQLEPTTITRVRVERPGREAIVLDKSGHTWRLTAPVAARANQFNVEQLLDLAQVQTELSIDSDENDLKRYELDEPKARVWLGDAEIDFGTMHPFENLHYVRHNEEIYLIPSRHFAPVSYPYSNFIDTRLIEEGRKPIAIKLRDFSVVLKDGAWRRTPEIKDLSEDRINGFVEEWRHASALSVERYSGKPPVERVQLTFSEREKNEILTFGVLAHKPDFILFRMDEGLQYHFPEEIGRRLLNLAPE